MSFRGASPMSQQQSSGNGSTMITPQKTKPQTPMAGWGSGAISWGSGSISNSMQHSPRAQQQGMPGFSTPQPQRQNSGGGEVRSPGSPLRFGNSGPAFSPLPQSRSPNYRGGYNSPSPTHSFQYHRSNSSHDRNNSHVFRTPHAQSPSQSPQHYSSGSGRGYGNGGRKSFGRQFSQNQRYDPNCNPGGSNNSDEYYHQTMLEDPWKFCAPVPFSMAPPSTT